MTLTVWIILLQLLHLAATTLMTPTAWTIWLLQPEPSCCNYSDDSYSLNYLAATTLIIPTVWTILLQLIWWLLLSEPSCCNYSDDLRSEPSCYNFGDSYCLNHFAATTLLTPTRWTILLQLLWWILTICTILLQLLLRLHLLQLFWWLLQSEPSCCNYSGDS